MKKVKFYLGTGFAGVAHEEIIEFDDNVTDEEIQEAFYDWYEDKLDPSWWYIEEKKGQ